LPRETPPAAVRLLRRCLQKEKDKRLRHIGDARLELEELLAGPAPMGESPPELRRPAYWPAVAILCALLGGLVSSVVHRFPAIRKEVIRLSVETSGPFNPALSPTGDRIVYRTPAGLAVRELDKLEGRVIPGTVNAWVPFFSPDGEWVGFNDWTDGTLKKVSLGGGAPVTLCKMEQSHGATWGPDDTIVFTRDNSSGLWQVGAAGGEPRELTKPDRARGEKSHRWPRFLPGGEAVLFTVGTNRLSKWDDARVEALVLRTGERRTILEGGTTPAYVESGHLVYRRGTSILAAPFDLDRLETVGPSVAVVEGVQSTSETGVPFFAVARTGMLVYLPQESRAERLVLVDRAGAGRPLTPWGRPVFEPRLSPDGRVIALTMPAANNQVWRFDIEREALSQVTFEWDNTSPVWTPDGEFLIVSSTPGWTLHRVRADGNGARELLLKASGERTPYSVTADGKLLAYTDKGTDTREDIWIMPLQSNGEPRVFLQTPADEGMPRISPDGRFLAYQSDESGQMEVYLRSFPDGSQKVQVSAGGGLHPVWARSGRELFYRVPLEGSKRRMMVADVSQASRIRVSRSRALFEGDFKAGAEDTPSYDVLPDGQHFVMIELDPQASRVTHFNVVLNWFEELRRLVPPK
jgi:hypothetical protein